MRLFREPLCHFLALGALLFVLYGLTRDRTEPAPNTITISAAQIALLQEQWVQQWGRLPTQQERQWLIDQHIRDEVLYREAKALGLDRDDTIIRRRLTQKMDFLFADVAALAEPSLEELHAFFARQADRYREPLKLSFTHIYFNPDHRRSRTRQDAERVLTTLRTKVRPPLRAPEHGDRFVLSYDYAQKTQTEVAREFGERFAAQLFGVPAGEWCGPIESGYGVHLVRVYKRLESTLPDFSAVQDKVKEDFLAAKRRGATEVTYQQLRERYTIIVAPILDASPAAVNQGAGQ